MARGKNSQNRGKSLHPAVGRHMPIAVATKKFRKHPRRSKRM